jgi:uncharacterized protein (TIGR03083 family)
VVPADLLARTYDGVTGLLRSLDEVDLLRPTRCAGWVVVDVLTHLLMDAERCLIAWATPTDDEPDLDAASYWSDWAEHVDPVAAARGTRFVRVQASAYRGPEGLLRHWDDTSSAAARALEARRCDERVRTQGHVLTAQDLASTLVVEAAVHHLDLLLDLPDAPRPPQEALDEVARVFSALAGVPLPATEAWALKGAGRLPLAGADRSLLGAAADRFPLLR